MKQLSERKDWKRNKTIAVLLAVFLGPWTWLYTYRRDPGKAAFGLGLNISFLTAFIFLVIQSKINPVPPGATPGDFLVFSGAALLQFPFYTWIAAILSSVSSKEYYLERTIKRTKLMSILLAVFLGPWTWLYTYRRDYWKFWPAAVIGAGGLGVWAFQTEAISKIVHSAWLPLCIIIWITSIIVSISRKGEWYRSFSDPNSCEIITIPR